MSQLDLAPQHEKIIRHILSTSLPVNVQVWVFGSRVKGNAKPYSDIDLAIDVGHVMPLSLLAKLSDAFEESDLPFRVDVVDWLTISDSFREHINTHKVRF